METDEGLVERARELRRAAREARGHSRTLLAEVRSSAVCWSRAWHTESLRLDRLIADARRPDIGGPPKK